jgi:hypothetical protein
MVIVPFNKALITDNSLMLSAKSYRQLVSMVITKYKRYLLTFLNQLFYLVIYARLNRGIDTSWQAMVCVAKSTLKLALLDQIFVLSFNHVFLYAIPTCCFSTTIKHYWFSLLKIIWQLA